MTSSVKVIHFSHFPQGPKRRHVILSCSHSLHQHGLARLSNEFIDPADLLFRESPLFKKGLLSGNEPSFMGSNGALLE